MGPWKMVSFFQEYHQERFSSRWQLVDGSEHNLLPVSLWVLPLWLAETSHPYPSLPLWICLLHVCLALALNIIVLEAPLWNRGTSRPLVSRILHLALGGFHRGQIPHTEMRA